MRLKFWERETSLETRQESSYTDTLTQLLVNQARGTTAANVNESGALEVASGIVGRCFSSVRIRTARPAVVSALSPSLLNTIGRSLIRSGEAVYLVKIQGGRLRLIPCSSWDVAGGYDENSWMYHVTLAGPSESVGMTVSGERVLHFRYATDAARPWKGIGPLDAAREAARLNAETNTLLADESSGPRGSVLPLPKNPDGTVDAIVANLKALNGGMTVVESMQGWAEKGATPKDEWLRKRIGPESPESLISLRHDADLLTLGCCGVPISMLDKADGTGLREAYRILLVSTLIPLGRVCSVEMQDKLESPGLAFDWSSIQAADVQGRARSWAALVGAGMEAEKASRLTGLND